MTSVTNEEDRKCLNCKNWKFKDAGAMAKHGFAPCAFEKMTGRMTSALKTCERFAAAEPEAIANRVAHMEGRRPSTKSKSL